METKNENLQYKTLIKRALGLIKVPLIIALVITPVRYFLELAGLPETAIFIIGLLWLTIAYSVYWGIVLYDQKHPYLLLFLCLIIFSPVSRIPVSLFWWIDTKWNTGTHYGLYFDSWWQSFINHIVYGSLVQVIPGFILGTITLAIVQSRKTVNIETN